MNFFLERLFLISLVTIPQLQRTAYGTRSTALEYVDPSSPVSIIQIRLPNIHGDLQLQGYNAQKASFSRTIHVKQIGHALLHLDAYNEDYLFTLPALHIESLIYGSPFVELNKSTYMVSSSGYIGKIDYAGKGWLSGKKNSFTATLYPEGKERDVLYTIEGQWTDSFIIRDGSKKGGEVDSYYAKKNKTTPLQVAPIAEQDDLESRKAWRKVAENINKGDMDTTNHEKSKIENSQRELRRKEQSEGREWERRFFTRVNGDPLFDKLAKPIGEKIESDKTGGIWRFDGEKAKKAKPPFQEHQGL